MMFFTDHTTISGVFSAIISFNFPVELVATTILTPALVIGVRRGLRIKISEPKKNENAEEKENE